MKGSDDEECGKARKHGCVFDDERPIVSREQQRLQHLQEVGHGQETADDADAERCRMQIVEEARQQDRGQET